MFICFETFYFFLRHSIFKEKVQLIGKHVTIFDMMKLVKVIVQTITS